ncbi:unnamed protein product, partial [Nesidiocoris tenuis]
MFPNGRQQSKIATAVETPHRRKRRSCRLNMAELQQKTANFTKFYESSSEILKLLVDFG